MTQAEVLAIQEENTQLRERVAELTVRAMMEVIDGV